MKLRDKFIVACLIFLLIMVHRSLFQAIKKDEGFFDNASDYTKLKERLITELDPYYKIDSFVREQLKTMLSASGASADTASLNETYTSIYSCSDPDASSRASCIPRMLGGLGPNTSIIYVSTDTYRNLPDWSEDESVSVALMKITDDLPERLVRESEWFAAIIKKLQDALAIGANPPGLSPVGTPGKIDGFTGTCSADAAKIKKLMSEAESCSVADVGSEIKRVNSLLDGPQLKKALVKMRELLAAMLKLQSDLEKAKNGTLYAWQQDGPKKSYPQFQGGDRIAALKFSMKQNQ